MKKFIRLEGIAVPLPRDNIDTDAIIPVPWMKSITPDFRRALFANWRWHGGDGVTEVGSFILNREPFRHARIVVGGSNFGCGSSREAAVWALLGFGIRCVIAPSFGDIFYENSFKNGLFPLILPEKLVSRIAELLEAGRHGYQMVVDFEAKTVTLPDGEVVPFEIDAGRRTILLEGLDEIGMTLRDISAIEEFQRRDRELHPWVYFTALDGRPIA
jgi:3-isopropylmalate/(R)-2-methylmalate dehydratase small subunit